MANVRSSFAHDKKRAGSINGFGTLELSEEAVAKTTEEQTGY